MSDLQLPDRLTQLRNRWEADPASRVFLQLAEEYRHLGRLHEALSVLETGLKEHPGYLSALVAKGRCLLELGSPDPAREVLERVVRQDATQAVANKLLVRAYLETGQTERAKERLDLYSLLHDGDPEIEELRGRIQRQDGEGKGEPRPSPASPSAAAAPARPAPAAGGDPFFLPPPGRPSPLAPATPARTAVRAQAGEGEVFHLDRPLARRPAVQDVFALDYPAVAAVQVLPESDDAAVAPPPPDDDEPEPTPEGEPFPGLVSRAVRQRYLAGLAAEGLFPSLQAPVAAPALPAAAVAPGEIFPLRSIGEAVEAELRRSPPEPVPAPEPEPEPLAAPDLPELLEAPEATPEDTEPEAATVTLGDLYLRQGHLAEAEGIFREVLRREPGNAAAQAGLARVTARREEPAAVPPTPSSGTIAGTIVEPIGPAATTGGGGDRRSRKILMLNGYLQRIRRGSHPDVP